MNEPAVTRVALSIARRWLTHAVDEHDLARSVEGHMVSVEQVQAEPARIADGLPAAGPVVAPYRPTGVIPANDVHLPELTA